MKTKIIAAMFVLCLLCSAAFAQPYAIRVTYYSNLRAGPSLESDTLAIAPPGAILQVIGSQGNWLQINRNGIEVWMANWVGHRLLENSQSESPTSDNCCFLEWQCQSDDEWINGYYAFQNNQCEHPGIAIEGSETFVAQVREALDLLQELAPQWYAYTDEGLDKIKEVAESYGSGVWVHLRAFNITAAHAAAGDVWLASIIVHDACHVQQFEAGQQYYGLEAERFCAQIQLEALKIINPDDSFQFGLPVVLENIEDPAYQWWH